MMFQNSYNWELSCWKIQEQVNFHLLHYLLIECGKKFRTNKIIRVILGKENFLGLVS